MAEQRQFVQFNFFAIDPGWRRLAKKEKAKAAQGVLEVMKVFQKDLLIHTYSTLGLKSDSDFMIWRIGYSLERFQQMSSALYQTAIGPYLRASHRFLAMTKHSTYVDKHRHEGQEGTRLRIEPGTGKYLFVYPFVKTREWYLLPQEKRQEMMDEHIRVGHKYPSVKLHTTYSFGLDDQEFVVAFETDEPADFLDLVMELRGSQGSRYTLRDTPIFTCVRKPLEEILEQLG